MCTFLSPDSHLRVHLLHLLSYNRRSEAFVFEKSFADKILAAILLSCFILACLRLLELLLNLFGRFGSTASKTLCGIEMDRQDSSHEMKIVECSYRDWNLEYFIEFGSVWTLRDKKRWKKTFYPADLKESSVAMKARKYWKFAMGFAFFCFSKRFCLDGRTLITTNVLHHSILLFHQFLVRSSWKLAHRLYCIFYLQCLYISLEYDKSPGVSIETLQDYLGLYKSFHELDREGFEHRLACFTYSVLRSIIVPSSRSKKQVGKPPDPDDPDFDHLIVLHIESMSWKQLELDVLSTLDFDVTYDTLICWSDYYYHAARSLDQQRYNIKPENLSWVSAKESPCYVTEKNLVHLFCDVCMLSSGILSNHTLTQMIVGSVAMAKCFCSCPTLQIESLMKFSQITDKDLLSFLISLSKSFGKWNSEKPPFDKLDVYWRKKIEGLFHSKAECLPSVLDPRIHWILGEKIFLEYFEPQQTNKHAKKLESGSSEFNLQTKKRYLAWVDREYQTKELPFPPIKRSVSSINLKLAELDLLSDILTDVPDV